MADREVDVLLIGGGVASANCALTLRDEGHHGSILVVGRELDPPYERPPCSKEFLRGEQKRSDTYVRSAQGWTDQGVELLTRTSVTALDTDARTATLSNKEQLSFDKALIATGAMVRRLAVDGDDLDELHYLRALGNSDAIRAGVADADDVVLIGGSYIGCEVAASLTSMGKKCTVVMQESHTFDRAFGTVAGRYFQGVLEDHGITFVGDDELERFEGSGDRVTKVVTKAGRELSAQAVVIGAGVNPDVMLAKSAGLELGDRRGGVKCSSRLETSVSGIYAAGDMCEYDSVVHGCPVRNEHHEVAIAHGRTVARNMLGQDVPFDAVPYFFSDLVDWASLEYVGPAVNGWDQEIVRGSLDDGEFAVFYLKDGVVSATLSVGRSEDLDHGRRFISKRIDAGGSSKALADVASDLGEIA